MKERGEQQNTSARLGTLWYIALTDLNRQAKAPTIHSREDARCLGKLGWEVTLLGQARGSYLPEKGSNEVVICRKSSSFNPFLHIMFEVRLIIHLLLAEIRPDFVFLRGPSPLAIFGFFLKLLDVRFGMELNGVCPYRYKKKPWSIKDYIQRLGDRFFMKNAALIVGVTKELKALAEKEKGKDAIVVVAPNGVNSSIYQPVPDRKKDGKDDRIVLGFVGNLFAGGGRGVGKCLEVIELLKRKKFQPEFIIVGDGGQRKELDRRAMELGISDRVKFMGDVFPTELPRILDRCDLALALFPDGPSIRLAGASPLKVWMYLSLEKPVLLLDPGCMDHLAQIPGIFIMNGDKPDFIAEFVIRLLNQYGRRGLVKLGKEGRKYVMENATWERHAEIISDGILNSLSTKRDSRSDS